MSVHEENSKLVENCKSCGQSDVSESEDNVTSENEMALTTMSFYGRRKPTVDEILEKAKNTERNGEVEKLFDKIDSWSFPIFDVWENGNVLRGVSRVNIDI